MAPVPELIQAPALAQIPTPQSLRKGRNGEAPKDI